MSKKVLNHPDKEDMIKRLLGGDSVKEVERWPKEKFTGTAPPDEVSQGVPQNAGKIWHSERSPGELKKGGGKIEQSLAHPQKHLFTKTLYF